MIEQQNFKLENILDFSLTLSDVERNNILNGVLKNLDLNRDSPERLLLHSYKKKYGWRFQNQPSFQLSVRQFLSVVARKLDDDGKLSKSFISFVKHHPVLMEDYIDEIVDKLYARQDVNFNKVDTFIAKSYWTMKLRKIAFEKLIEEMNRTPNVDQMHLSVYTN